MRGVRLERATLNGANLAGADLSPLISTGSSGRVWQSALSYARFRKADLTDAKLIGAVLKGACFDDANLRDADLSEAEVADASFRGADLTGAKLDGTNMKLAHLR